MKDFSKFAELHREALFSLAEKNTKYNKDERAVISKDDTWFNPVTSKWFYQQTSQESPASLSGGKFNSRF